VSTEQLAHRLAWAGDAGDGGRCRRVPTSSVPTRSLPPAAPASAAAARRAWPVPCGAWRSRRAVEDDTVPNVEARWVVVDCPSTLGVDILRSGTGR
jgi:hypothetical protein